VVVQHAARICQQMVEAQLPQDDHPELCGCFQPDGRTTPTATRLEGLLASLRFLPQDQTPLRQDVVAACHRGVAFLLRSQITEGDARGAIPSAISPLPEIPQSLDDAFRRRVSEVRIDYVQHVLSALVEYRALFLSDGG
jgi:hypothetical protein